MHLIKGEAHHWRTLRQNKGTTYVPKRASMSSSSAWETSSFSTVTFKSLSVTVVATGPSCWLLWVVTEDVFSWIQYTSQRQERKDKFRYNYWNKISWILEETKYAWNSKHNQDTTIWKYTPHNGHQFTRTKKLKHP